MNVEKLMIGDWIHFNVPGVQYCKINSAERLGYLLKNADLVSPIPITREILKKNGFWYDGTFSRLPLGDGAWLEYYHHEDRFRIWWNGVDEWKDGYLTLSDLIFQCEIMFVHELQHALRLCGINKEIEL